MRRPRERERESLDTCYTPLLQHIHWASSQICANIGFYLARFHCVFWRKVFAAWSRCTQSNSLSRSLARAISPHATPFVSSPKAYSLHLLNGADVVFTLIYLWSTVTAQDVLHLHYGTSCKSRPNRDQGLSRPSRSEGASKRTEFANSFTSSASGDCSHATSSEKRRNASAASPPAMAR